MSDIKLFVCCHQPTRVPKHPLLVPIQVGSALAEREFANFLHDNTGDNISAKNRSYCELTAQYWAWKNCGADYYGFFHYRRYLYPDARAKRPYRIEREPTFSRLEKLGYGAFQTLIEQYDLIVPKGEDMHIPVREHYASALYHCRADLKGIEQIVQERHSEMSKALEAHFSGTVCYFGNIYIMRRATFYDYCSWLFPILEEFDRRTDFSNYSLQERRVDGYLAERLLGVYYMHRRMDLKTLELPRVHFEADTKKYVQNQLICSLLPPGTQRRCHVKRWARRMA